MGFFTSEFGHHSGPAGNSCCLLTLAMLLTPVALVIGAVLWAVTS